MTEGGDGPLLPEMLPEGTQGRLALRPSVSPVPGVGAAHGPQPCPTPQQEAETERHQALCTCQACVSCVLGPSAAGVRASRSPGRALGGLWAPRVCGLFPASRSPVEPPVHRGPCRPEAHSPGTGMRLGPGDSWGCGPGPWCAVQQVGRPWQVGPLGFPGGLR